jgi:hypothetical protein
VEKGLVDGGKLHVDSSLVDASAGGNERYRIAIPVTRLDMEFRGCNGGVGWYGSTTMRRVLNFGRYVAVFALLLFGFTANGQLAPAELKPEILGALKEATNVVLYSLIPNPVPGTNEASSFGGYKILGNVTLGKQSAKTALDEVIPTIKDWTPSDSHCIFQPRHGLRVTVNGGDYILVLCYHCEDIAIRTPAGKGAYLHLTGSPDVLDHLLEQNKIRLTP